jgi:hypothetical protein
MTTKQSLHSHQQVGSGKQGQRETKIFLRNKWNELINSLMGDHMSNSIHVAINFIHLSYFSVLEVLILPRV